MSENRTCHRKMKFQTIYHGDVFRTYDSLEELLADEWMFKNVYSYGSFYIQKIDDLSEEEEKIIDARSWELRDWGYLPDPRSSGEQRMNKCVICNEKLESPLDDYEISFDRDYNWHFCEKHFTEALDSFTGYINRTQLMMEFGVVTKGRE